MWDEGGSAGMRSPGRGNEVSGRGKNGARYRPAAKAASYF